MNKQTFCHVCGDGHEMQHSILTRLYNGFRPVGRGCMDVCVCAREMCDGYQALATRVCKWPVDTARKAVHDHVDGITKPKPGSRVSWVNRRNVVGIVSDGTSGRPARVRGIWTACNRLDAGCSITLKIGESRKCNRKYGAWFHMDLHVRYTVRLHRTCSETSPKAFGIICEQSRGHCHRIFDICDRLLGDLAVLAVGMNVKVVRSGVNQVRRGQ